MMAAMAKYEMDEKHGKEKVAKEIPETSYQPLPVKFANWRREVRKSLRELWRSLTAMVWGSVLAWLLGSRRWDRPSSAAV